MKILLINKFYYLAGGPERYLFESMKLLSQKGHRVISFSMFHPRNEKSEFSRFFVDKIEYESRNGFFRRLFHGVQSIYSIKARKNITALINYIKPDIAHLHSFCYQLTPSILYPLRAKGIPIIHTAHEYKLICPNQRLYNLYKGNICECCKGLRFYRAMSERCIKNSLTASVLGSFEANIYKFLHTYESSINTIIAPSRFLRDKLIEYGFGDIPIIHMPNFINIDEYMPSYENHGYILYFGRISRNKGLITLCRAMRGLDNVKLKIVGEGEYERELRKMIDEERIENVEILGYNAGNDLIGIIKYSICTIVPSEWYENCPFSILESFALGKPVIGARIGGIPELIDDGVDGFLFTPGDTEELKHKIQYMIHDRVNASTMGKNGRNKIEQKYSADKHYSAVMQLYNKLITEQIN